MTEIERALRLGDFTVKPQLRELLFSEAEAFNPRWPSLWASVATHDEVFFELGVGAGWYRFQDASSCPCNVYCRLRARPGR